LRIPMILAAAAGLALSGPSLAQVVTGSTVRGAIIGAVIDGPAGDEIGRVMDLRAFDVRNGAGPAASVARVGQGMVVRLNGDSLFAASSEQILPEGRQALDRLSVILNGFSGGDVVIVGHTDSAGDAAARMSRSWRHAEAAKAHLVGRGVASSRIRVEARGSTEPVASNEEPAGRAQNRRLEIGVYAGEAHREAMQAQYGG
jgi:outer membrane protein OmpA-like peptidoglycan-associated protein